MGKNFVISLGLVALIGVGVANAQGFERLIKLSYGADDIYERTPCFAADMDHDSLMEFGMWCADEDYIFEGWQIWKCIPVDSSVDSFVMVKQVAGSLGDTTKPGMIIWDVGDVDGDGKTELVGINFGSGLHVQTVESEDHYDYPAILNWSSKFSPYAYFSTPFYLTDLDKDGKTDILFLAPGMNAVLVYENVSNDSNRLVWSDTLTGKDYSLFAFAWGDFDGDGKTEFLSGGMNGDFVVWENTGQDNRYASIYKGHVGVDADARDVFGGRDMDGDGKPDFFISSIMYSGGIPQLRFYKGIDDNKYDSTLVAVSSWVLSTAGTARSAVGDVDGDSLLEVVWSLKSRVLLLDDAQHSYTQLGEWTSDHGLSPIASLVTCSDLDLDGKDEILVTGCFRTSILKWTGTGVEEGKPAASTPSMELQVSSMIQRAADVRLTLNEPQWVRICVYDNVGRLVEKLAEGSYNAGEYRFTWDASSLPAGTYIVQAIDHTKISRKVTVLR